MFLYLRSFTLAFEFNVLIDLITWHSQSGNKIDHVLLNPILVGRGVKNYDILEGCIPQSTPSKNRIIFEKKRDNAILF